VLGRVQPQRVDRRRADRHEVVTGLHVVVGEEDDVLELVDVQLALAQRRVGLVVVGEVDDVDRDALGLDRLLVDGPVRLARADDAQLDRVLLGAELGVAAATTAARRHQQHRPDGGRGDDRAAACVHGGSPGSMGRRPGGVAVTGPDMPTPGPVRTRARHRPGDGPTLTRVRGLSRRTAGVSQILEPAPRTGLADRLTAPASVVAEFVRLRRVRAGPGSSSARTHELGTGTAWAGPLAPTCPRPCPWGPGGRARTPAPSSTPPPD